MILYREDWNRFPSAIADFKTTNESFLRYSVLLDEMGIKNCLFPLALYQKELVGVDPYDPNLNSDLQYRIGLEVSANPWYYLREVHKFAPNTGADGTRVIANRGIISLWWTLLNNVTFFLLQPRQTGKSVGVDAMTNYLMLFKLLNNKISLLTKSNELLVTNIARLKKARASLPPYLIKLTKADKDNLDSYNYYERNNEILAHCAQKDINSANNVGRGSTTPIQEYDEPQAQKYFEIMYPAAASASNAARREAKKIGASYWTSFTATAGDLTTKHGKFVYHIYKSGAPFTETLYDLKNKEELVDYMKKNGDPFNPYLSATFSHNMLGISDEEHFSNARNSHGTEESINMDYFLIWATGGVESILHPGVANDISNSEMAPAHIEITKDCYAIKWYIPEDKIDEYMEKNYCILGSDTSELIGRDSTTFILTNIETLETVAVFGVNESNTNLLADWIASFIIKYTNILLVMERKSSAVFFIDRLIIELIKNNVNPFRRIYNRIIDEPERFKSLYEELTKYGDSVPAQFVDQNRKYFGFMQTGDTRTYLYGTILKQYTKRARNVIYDKTLSTEIRSLKSINGRIDHSADEHDDHVMAWCLGCAILESGRNLSYYGIDSKRILLRVTDDGIEKTENDHYTNILVEKYTKEINRIAQLLGMTDSEVVISEYEKKLCEYNEKLKEMGHQPKSIDGILNKIKSERELKIRELRLNRPFNQNRNKFGIRGAKVKVY